MTTPPVSHQFQISINTAKESTLIRISQGSLSKSQDTTSTSREPSTYDKADGTKNSAAVVSSSDNGRAKSSTPPTKRFGLVYPQETVPPLAIPKEAPENAPCLQESSSNSGLASFPGSFMSVTSTDMRPPTPTQVRFGNWSERSLLSQPMIDSPFPGTSSIEAEEELASENAKFSPDVFFVPTPEKNEPPNPTSPPPSVSNPYYWAFSDQKSLQDVTVDVQSQLSNMTANRTRPKRLRGKFMSLHTRSPGPSVCRCKKTQCLKLYCVCFQAGNFCVERCKCSRCKNTEDFGGKKGSRTAAVKAIKKRRPDAFDIKIKARGMGCMCRKNR